MKRVTAALSALAGLSAALALTSCTHTQNGPPPGTPSGIRPSTASPLSEVKFTDVTQEAGLDFIQSNGSCGQNYFIEQVAAGAAVFDANGDGFLDIYFPQPKAIGACVNKIREPLHHRLYINDGKGHFTLKADAFDGVETDYGIAAAVGDFNNDGLPDLYVCCYGRNRLFQNMGNGKFKDVTAQAGVGLKGFSTGAVWFDYDGDGHLDLLVGRYCDWSVAADKQCGTKENPDICSPLVYTPSTCILYHSNGNGTFTDVTKQAGIGQELRRTLGIAAVDFEGKGITDLFIANDMQQNYLYKNLSKGKFEDVAAQMAVILGEKTSPQANMGVAIGDYDEDGYLDILVTTFSNEPYTLYRNEQNQAFTDVSRTAGITDPTMSFLGFGTGFLDTRNLGRLDLFFANGHVNPYINKQDARITYKERNQLLLNDGSGKFLENADALPKDDVRVHKGACFGDFNNDGRIDILVTASNDRPTLLRNDSPQKNWLMLKLINKYGCATPIGTRCTATFNGQKRLRIVLGGGSYGGESDHRVHFGLGDAKTVDKVEIHWLDGTTQTLTHIPANQILTVQEGKETGKETQQTQR